MPKQFSRENQIFIDKVEEGLKQSKSRNVKTREQAKEKLSKWLK